MRKNDSPTQTATPTTTPSSPANTTEVEQADAKGAEQDPQTEPDQGDETEKAGDVDGGGDDRDNDEQTEDAPDEQPNVLGTLSGQGSDITQDLERQVAILKSDNDKLIAKVRAYETTADEWRQAVGVGKDENPGDAIKLLNDSLAERDERVVALQGAFGVAPGDDPYEAVQALLKKAEGDIAKELSELPPVGLLLLLPALARLNAVDGFNACPTVMYPGNGDEWMVTVDENTIPPVVTLHVRYDAMGHQAAQIDLKQVETEIGNCLKQQKMAEKRAEDVVKRRRKDPVLERDLTAQAQEIRTKLAALQARQKALAPLAESKGSRTWRFSGSLDDFGKGAL